MTSKYIKACLSAYFRFGKGVKFIATEVGMFNSDFLAICKTTLIEAEIKTSIVDLNNDFKKKKHKIYETARSDWTPTQFYFAVPPNLVAYAITKCVDKKYGVLMIREELSRQVSQRSPFYNEDIKKTKARIAKLYKNVIFLRVKETNWCKVLIEFEHDTILPWHDRVRVVKKAKKLTERPPPNKVRHAMIARLSSEMANLRIDEQVVLLKDKK